MTSICIACRKAHRGKCPDGRPRQKNGRLQPWARKNTDLQMLRDQLAAMQARLDTRRMA